MSKVSDLVEAVNSIEVSGTLSDTDYENLWASQDPIFECCKTNIFTRLNYLVQGIDKVEKLPSLSACATRLTLLFVLHDMDRIEARILKKELSSGRGRRSIALDKIENTCGLERKRIKELLRRGAIYLALAKIFGLGCLLAIGYRLDV